MVSYQITLGQVQAKLKLLGNRVQPGFPRDSAKPFRPSGEARARGAAPERGAP
jgi:hypothetical protein